MAVDQDATSGKYVPSSSAQWDELLSGSGISAPAHLYLLQEASGNPADSIGTKTLTASGTLAYQQTVSGWSRKSIKTTGGSAGKMINTTFGNVNANSFTVLLIGKTGAVATTRTLLRMGDVFDDDATLEFTSTPRLQVGEGDGTRSVGSSDPTGAVHYFFLRIDDAGNQVDGFLNTTKITGGTQSCNGTELCFGGDNVQTWFPNDTDYMYAAVWSSALSDGDISTVVDRIDNGPPAAAVTFFSGPLARPAARKSLRPPPPVAQTPVTQELAATQLASGTTLAALQAGSASFKYVVAIEGYSNLLTDATPSQAVNAWYTNQASHYYTSALGGLFVSMENSQQLDWRKPFPLGGRLTLHVAPDASGTFMRDVYKRDAGQQTEQRVTVSRTIDADTGTAIVPVRSTTGWSSSGEAYVGTECFGYSGLNSNTFLGAVRGKYAPMLRQSGAGWSEHHRVGQNALEVKLNPRVTSLPRVWIGKWLTVYLHKYDPSIPALNSRENALVVFTGRIVAISDDPATGCIAVEVKHVLDCVAEATLAGRDQWSAKIRNTIYVRAGWRFKMKDRQSSTSSINPKTANDLVVVSGTPAHDGEMKAGYYTLPQIFQKINAWWLYEKGNSRIHGNYSIGYWLPPDNTVRTYIWWGHGASSSTIVEFAWSLPQPIAARMGFTEDGSNVVADAPVGGIGMTKVADANGDGSGQHSSVSGDYVRRSLANGDTAGSPDQVNGAQIDDQQGSFIDQYDYLPSSAKPPSSGGNQWGIFLVDNRFLAYGRVSGAEIPELRVMPQQFGLDGAFGNLWYELPLLQNGPQDTDIRQVFILEMQFGDALKRIFKSTGTSGYNDSTWDVLAYGLGLGLPHQITDSTFLASIDALPNVNSPVVLVLDRQTRLSDLLAGELILRRSFLRWKQGRLEFATWKSPTETNSVATLTEANKAAPADNVDHHRSVTVEDGSWAAAIQKIQYNRSLKASPDGKDGYRDSLVIVDKSALDDLGGDAPALTISARGTMGDFAQTGSTVGSLAAGFMASMPFFSRPARRMSRSVDQRYFETVSIGDIIAITDEYAIDPATGARGVTTRYAIVLRSWYSLGGLRPGSDVPDPAGGGVDVFFLDINRLATYVPTAQVDDTQTNAGYTDATKTLICYARKHAESTEAVDASRFAAGDKVRIVEIDPSDPASPTSWDRTVSSVSGNSIVLTTTLSSPAWDNTKKYRIIFDDYSDAVATQQLKTFQADDADHMIADTRAPYEYGVGGGDSNYTAWSASDPVELPPDSSYGDGVGRDVGHDVALARLINNLNSYKTAHSTPWLNNAAMNTGLESISFGTATYLCVLCFPIDLGQEVLLNDVWRRFAVAPFLRSRDGSSQTCRITLSRTAPSDSDWFDVDRGALYSEITFTTSSTALSTPTPDNLVANVKAIDGTAWVYVEVSSLCEIWGFAHGQEGAILY